MAHFADDKETPDPEKSAEYYATFGSEYFSKDCFVNIGFVISAPPHMEGDELHKFIEAEGLRTLSNMLTPEAMNKKWCLEDYD